MQSFALAEFTEPVASGRVAPLACAMVPITVMASFALLTGSELARWFGIAVASVNAIGQLMFVHANSWWAVCMFAVDILVIYGLAAYAGSRLRAR